MHECHRSSRFINHLFYKYGFEFDIFAESNTNLISLLDFHGSLRKTLFDIRSKLRFTLLYLYFLLFSFVLLLEFHSLFLKSQLVFFCLSLDFLLYFRKILLEFFHFGNINLIFGLDFKLYELHLFLFLGLGFYLLDHVFFSFEFFRQFLLMVLELVHFAIFGLSHVFHLLPELIFKFLSLEVKLLLLFKSDGLLSLFFSFLCFVLSPIETLQSNLIIVLNFGILLTKKIIQIVSEVSCLEFSLYVFGICFWVVLSDFF